MSNNELLLKTLNDLLADELTAISQYMVHSEMCEQMGLGKLHEAIEHQAKEEMSHAEWLIGRILFLGGHPTMTKLNQIRVGKDVLAMIGNDEEAEAEAMKAYNDAIVVAGDSRDAATADLLTTILKMEEEHFAWGRTQRRLIDQMGLENFVSLQAGSAK